MGQLTATVSQGAVTRSEGRRAGSGRKRPAPQARASAEEREICATVRAMPVMRGDSDWTALDRACRRLGR